MLLPDVPQTHLNRLLHLLLSEMREGLDPKILLLLPKLQAKVDNILCLVLLNIDPEQLLVEMELLGELLDS